MSEEEMIALLPTITELLAAPQFRNDLEQIEFIIIELLGADRMKGHDALEDLQDLLADIAQSPDITKASEQEWDERRADFCHAAQLYLDERWPRPEAADRLQ